MFGVRINVVLPLGRSLREIDYIPFFAHWDRSYCMIRLQYFLGRSLLSSLKSAVFSLKRFVFLCFSVGSKVHDAKVCLLLLFVYTETLFSKFAVVYGTVVCSAYTM